jgi:hypothetical protein
MTSTKENRSKFSGHRRDKKFLAETDLRLLINEEVSNLKAQIKDKERMIGDYRKEHGVLETFFRELQEHIAPIKPQPQFYNPTPRKGSVETPIVAVMQINDGHMGMVQSPTEIEGFGQFDPGICRDRQLKFAQKVLDWVSLHRNSYALHEIVVPVLGDMISGDIHEDLRVTNAFPSPVQACEAGMLLSDQVAMLAPHFTRVRVEFITEDNHARLTRKPQAHEAGFNSLNYVVGFIAKQRLSALKNVAFNIYPQYEAVIEVAGRRYLCCHGHDVMGWAGFPYYGIERKVAREALKRMNAPDMNKFHKVLLGHWHAPLAHPWYWIGGSVSGTDALDHKQGRHSPPSQAAWIVHPKHGEFNRTDFWL